MYEFMGQQRRRSVRGVHGFGALPGDDGCPPMTSRFGIPGGTCFPIFGQPQSASTSCPPGSTPFVDPLGSGVFVCLPAGSPPPIPVPPPAPGVTSCPDGSTGVPPFCFTMPAVPGGAVPPSPGVPTFSSTPCPPGTMGVPPVCIPTQQAQPGGAGPIPAPAPTPAAQAAAPAPSTTPAWLVPVAVGVGALALFALVVRKPHRATPNRRRHR